MRQCAILMFEYTLSTYTLISYAFVMHALSNLLSYKAFAWYL